MDDYGFPDDGCFGYAQPFDTFSVPDHYAESYNYATIDPIAIMLRQQREDDEQRTLDAAQRMPEAEPALTWSHAAPSQAYASAPDYESTGGKASAKAAAKEALRRVDDPDTPHSYWAAKAAGHKYYYLPTEPASWRRPLRGPSGGYDPVWEKMFCNADELSRYLAKHLGYIGARDDDGWIRPTCWELLRMGFWSAQRYAFYYAEFAEEFGRKIPRWIGLLRPVRKHAPSEEFWA